LPIIPRGEWSCAGVHAAAKNGVSVAVSAGGLPALCRRAQRRVDIRGVPVIVVVHAAQHIAMLVDNGFQALELPLLAGLKMLPLVLCMHVRAC
jgi:hypothetical protein